MNIQCCRVFCAVFKDCALVTALPSPPPHQEKSEGGGGVVGTFVLVVMSHAGHRYDRYGLIRISSRKRRILPE